jgi:hypothetical protein
MTEGAEGTTTPTAAPSLPPGARCALHPERDATSTCTRCGNYACRECAGGFGLCSSCEQRSDAAVFPFDRDHYSLDGLFGHTLARYKQHWLVLALVFVGFFVVVYGLAAVGGVVIGQHAPRAGSFVQRVFSPSFVVMQVVQTTIQIAFQLALIGLCLDIAQGKQPDLGAALGRVRRLPAALLQLLIMYLPIALYAGTVAALAYGLPLLRGQGSKPSPVVVALGAVVGLVPLFYYGLGVMFAMTALVNDAKISAVDALRTSLRFVEGQRWHVLGITLVSGIVAMAGVLVCCVGALATLPFATVLHCSLFLALAKEGRTR